MAIVEYLGGAFDHDTIPQVLKKRKDGKDAKRRVLQVAKTIHIPIETYNLWGMQFPKGDPKAVEDVKLLKKACGLPTFKVVVRRGDPLTHDEKFMAKVLPLGRIVVLDKDAEMPSAEAPTPLVEEKVSFPEDPYEGLKRTDLTRLASSRSMNVPASMKKAEIIEMLREDDKVVEDEIAAEGTFYDPEGV